MNLQDFTLDSVELALAELGWESRKGVNQKLKIWYPTHRAKLESAVADNETVRVFVPQDEEAPDFHQILHDAVTEFADLSAANVLEELATSKLRIERNLDKIVVSTDGPAVRSGVVGWRMGARLVDGLGEILKSGARTAQEPKRWYKGVNHVIAGNYLDSCLMGQTEVGSYVVKAFIPANEHVSVSNSTDVKKHSYLTARQVTETVFTSVEATKDVLEEFVKERKPEAFEWATTQGVSVEMLSGFRSLIGTDETEISVEFISTDAGSRDRKPYRGSVVLGPTLKEAVEIGMKTLQKVPQLERIDVAGDVIVLARESNDPNSHRIKLRTLTREGKQRVYSIHLNQEDYAKALQAHEKQVQFLVHGVADKGKFIEVHSVRVTDAPVSAQQPTHPRNNSSETPGQLNLLDETYS